jgi:capsular exopolysaccharide synthesis family protein
MGEKVSRIFEALRRMEQIKNGVGVEIPQGAAAQSLNVLKVYSREPEGLEKVERVAYRPQPESHVLGDGERDRAGLERFRLLRYRLYRLREQRTLRSVLVTSAIPQEGKSMVSANLAATLAQASDRVLLVDADLRKPSLHSFLGLRATEGLADLLQGRVEFLSACRRVDPLGFVFLTAGRSPANPVELLQGESMRGLVKSTTTTFDWVVIDSPPVLPLADARFLAALCDAVIFVAREGHTRREELQRGLAALKGTYIAGIVLNTSRSASENAYSYIHPTPPTEDDMKRPGDFGRQAARVQAASHG